jgi:catechol 2,3-dioxygenase-like lactoylglutathione lyase family enzyme
MMFDHVSIGVADVPRSKRFYDRTLEPLGCSCLSDGEDSLGYGRETVRLWVNRSERPVAPVLESGLHFCFVAPTRDSVDRFHAAALHRAARTTADPACASPMATATMRPS